MNTFRYQHIKSITHEDLLESISNVFIDNSDPPSNAPFDFSNINPATASKMLYENGIITLDDVIPRARALSYGELASHRIREILKAHPSNSLYEDQQFCLQGPLDLKYDDYYKLVNSNKSVFNRRPLPDLGFVDLFNPEIILPEIKGLISLVNINKIIDILNKCNIRKNYKLSNINLYFNDGHSTTRYFHADSFTPQAKFFIYLSDVGSLDSGAHQYVLGSHLDEKLRLLNTKFNKNLGEAAGETDFTIFNRNRILSVTANAGSGFLSFQSGAHRGHPMKSDKIRCVLTFNFSSSD